MLQKKKKNRFYRYIFCFAALLTSISHTAKKAMKSKQQLLSERKQELEKRLLDVNGQLNPKKENFKCNVNFIYLQQKS